LSRAGLLSIEAARNGSDDNFLQKIRNQIKLGPMNKPALPNGFGRKLPSCRGSQPAEKAREKIFRESLA
jgi:hypothetical protein